MTHHTVETHAVDLTIIGSGFAGMSAALFAVNRGLSVMITGQASAMNFASGLMDLMSVHPAGNEWDDPWAAIERVRRDIPGHPYGRVTDETIGNAFREMTEFLGRQQLPYDRAAFRNVNVVTSVGTVKKSYLVPGSMWRGVEAFEAKSPSLIVDFTGMKSFSARQIAQSLGGRWPGLRTLRLQFPGTEILEEVYPEHIARSLDVTENRKRLAELILPHIGEVEFVGFPALLGMSRVREATEELEKLIGRPVFEIPTPPVSVPGIRLQEALLNGLAENELLQSLPDMVKKVDVLSNGCFQVVSERSRKERLITSRGVVLATGRFLGKGLVATRTGIEERLIGLPVFQPESRGKWHSRDLFDPCGHAVNRAGIETDDSFRPLAAPFKPFAEQCYAVGSILAHSDWTRMKCGSGVALATAFAAVEMFHKGY